MHKQNFMDILQTEVDAHPNLKPETSMEPAMLAGLKKTFPCK
jgi:hypothetical protein